MILPKKEIIKIIDVKNKFLILFLFLFFSFRGKNSGVLHILMFIFESYILIKRIIENTKKND